MVMKTIYVLRDPRDGCVRYVGATQSALYRRCATHRGMSRCMTSRVAVWLRELLEQGYRPTIEKIEEPTSDWENAERAAIARYRATGVDLLNETDGGMGCLNCVPGEETRAKRSKTLKARYANDPAQMAARQALMREAGRSLNSRKAASARMARIWADPEQAAAMRERMRGAKARKVLAPC